MKLPDGWRKIRLIDCGRWVGGSTPSKKESQYWNGSIPWASSQDIKSRLLKKTTYSLTEAGLRSSSNLVPANSLLMVTRSGILRHTFPVTKTLFAVAINQDIKALIPDKDFNVDYIQAVLLAENFDILKRCSKVGTTVESIEYDVLKSYSIVVPPLPEQRRIAEFLGTWDEAIEKLEQLIAAKEKRFHGLIQRALAFEKSEHISFSKIFEVISEKNQPALPLLSVTQNNGVIPRDMLEGRVMSPEGSLEGYKVVQKKDFVVSLRSFQGGLEYSHFTGLISPAYTVLRARKKIDHEFYRFFFKSYAFIHHYLDLAVIGIRDGKQISIPDLLTIAIPFPDIQKQKNIAFELGLNEKEINLLKEELAALQKQKRGLMQKLLTGTWRV